MNKPFLYVVLTILFFLKINVVYGQQSKKIRIEYAGFAVSDSTQGKGVTAFVRDNKQQIHISHESINMWCDKAEYYENDNFVKAYGKVNLIQGDTINLNADYLNYSGKTLLAYASGNVVLTDPKSTLTTDTLYFDRAKQQAYYESKGKVVRDTSGTITSQIGRYYMKTKKYQFVKDVKLVNPNYTINTEKLDFYTITGHAFLFGPTTIVNKNNTIYCERGFYDTNNDNGYFVRHSKINYENRVIEGDSIYFDGTRNFAAATNNIIITDTLNKSIIRGHYAEVHKAKDSVFITKRALAISLQDKDSLYMHSDTIMVTGKPDHRITRAYNNVKLFKSNLSGKSDSIHVDHKSGLIQLINIHHASSSDAFSTIKRPILWNFKNQITGDSIHIVINPKIEKIDSLKVFDNAFIISKDTLGDGYNQIKGQKLYGLFKDNELYQVDIVKNAEAIYYMRNDENELIGIDKSTSASISVYFSNRTIEMTKKFKQVECQTYPDSQFPQNVRKFRGFDWREEERPKSVEDLFKDDPPLNLPVIKGLKKYVSQEDFFDNTVKRVKTKHKKPPLPTPNKSGFKQRKKIRPKYKPKQFAKDSLFAPYRKSPK